MDPGKRTCDTKPTQPNLPASRPDRLRSGRSRDRSCAAECLAFARIGQQPDADRRIGTGSGATVTDNTVHGRADFRIADIQQRQIAIGDGLRERGLNLLLFRVDDIEPAFCRIAGNSSSISSRRWRLSFSRAAEATTGCTWGLSLVPR